MSDNDRIEEALGGDGGGDPIAAGSPDVKETDTRNSSRTTPSNGNPETTANSSKKKKKKKRKSGNVSGKGGNSNHGNKSGNKRRKTSHEKFWIEDCSDSVLPPSYYYRLEGGNTTEVTTTTSPSPTVPFLELLITRSTLVDDYRQAPAVVAVPVKEDSTKDCKVTKLAEEVGETVAAAFQNTSTTQDDTMRDSSSQAEKDPSDNNNNEPAAEQQPVPKKNEMSTPLKFSTPKSNTDSNSNPSIDTSRAFICVKRAHSAKQPMHVTNQSVENFKPLPNGDCGDGIINPYPKSVVADKFWSQRRRLFTRFDEGIQLDPESWFSVTPEAIANHIAAHLVGNRRLRLDDADDDRDSNTSKLVVLDPFGGCGGNSIAFAQRAEVELVVSVDTDLEKLKMAASNAAIYGIPQHKMIFVHDNGCRVMSCFENGKRKQMLSKQGQTNQPNIESSGFRIGGLDILPSRVDCIFLSPPWGGINYGECGKRNYTLQHIEVDGIHDNDDGDEETIDGEGILKYAADCLGGQGPIAYFLPKNTNGIEFGRSVLRAGCSEGPVVMEQNVLNGKLKTITAYIGL